MERYQKIRISTHDLILKLLILVLFSGTIVYIFPREGKFKYDIRKGKRWMENDLIAPFDFGIQKTQKEIQEEKLFYEQNQVPYYSVDSLIPIRKIQQFNSLLSQEWDQIYLQIAQDNAINDTSNNTQKNLLFEVYRESGIKVLERMYSPGVIDYALGYAHEFARQPVVLQNNIVVETSTHPVYVISDVSKHAYKFVPEQYLDIVDSAIINRLIIDVIEPNIFFDESTTRHILETRYENISLTKGLINKGDLIIARGEIVNEEKFQVLISLKNEFETQSGFAFNLRHLAAGQALLVFVSLFLIFAFIFTFRKDIYAQNRKIFFILLMILSAVAGAKITLDSAGHLLYVLPLCIVPVLVRVFFDTRLALFVHLITTLLIGYIAPNGYEFVLLQIIAGFVAIISIYNMRRRVQLFISAGIVFLAYSITYIAITTVQEGSVMHLNINSIYIFGFNAFLFLFAYPLLYAFEKIFGFTSEVTLLELSDTNSTLLRELAEKAPGTFQHSLQVANLAEEAAYRIGGNTLLARAGALYHDIGKIDMPLFFIENQNMGINPHDELSFEESARIIISHVEIGIEKAKRHKLPDIIIDFIRTHHGTTKVQYFYQNFLKDFPEIQVDEACFCYRGPEPFSKESAIVMMADSVEAASRSLKISDPTSIGELVDSIIDNQINQRQFANADITFKDITTIKKIFRKKLSNMHHVRIEYPKE